MTPTLIPHIDDLGVTAGSVVAMEELARAGVVTSGSFMVPTPSFDEVVALASRHPDLDLGIHLTLTSESDFLKWGPLTAPNPGSGLVDDNGHFWKTVQEVRDRADPRAVGAELRAQIEIALAAGIDATHLDHHMGAAINPEFAEITLSLGAEYGIPVLFPRKINAYFELLGKGPVDRDLMTRLRDRLEQDGRIIVDHFVMGLETPGATAQVYRDLISELSDGVTFLSLHCSAPGEIEQVHPRSYQRRIEEYRLFADPDFVEWFRSRAVALTNFRRLAAR